MNLSKIALQPTAFVVGAGRMGKLHIANARNAGLKIVGVYDNDPKQLKMAKEVHDVDSKYIFSDFEKMCDSATPDLAVIATTTPSHCEFGIRLSQHGVKLLFIEKPLGASIAQCEALAEQCKKAGTRVAVNHMFRYLPVIKKIKELLNTESLGGFTSLSVNGINSGIAMMGSHFIDLFAFFSESPILTVTSWLKKSDEVNPRGDSYTDLAGLLVAQSANGHRLIQDFPSDQGQGLEILFCARYGMLRCNLYEASIEGFTRIEPDRCLPLTRSDLESLKVQIKLEKTDWSAASVLHLKNLIQNNAIVSLKDGANVVDTLVAAHKSTELGNIPIQINENDHFRSDTFTWA